jgi:hypothetical protein
LAEAFTDWLAEAGMGASAAVGCDMHDDVDEDSLIRRVNDDP